MAAHAVGSSRSTERSPRRYDGSMRWVLTLSIVTLASCGLYAVGTKTDGDAGAIDGRDVSSPVGEDGSGSTTDDGSTQAEDGAGPGDGAPPDGPITCPGGYVELSGGS